MSNNPVISPVQELEKAMSHSPIKWRNSLLLGFVGLIWLAGGIGSLQDMTVDFADDIYNLTFIENWMSWIVVSFFALGWFLTHWVEIELSKNQVRAAKLLMVIIALGGLLVSVYFKYLSNNEVLNHIGLAAFFLIMSGNFLRYSIFREEYLVLLQKRF